MRKTLRLSILLSMALLVLSSCVKTPEETLCIFTWSCYTPEDVVTAFEEEYGCKVVFDYFSSNEEMLAKILASKGTSYDLVIPSGDYVSILASLGLLREIDHSRLPNLKYLTPFASEKGVFDPGWRYSVPYNAGAAGIAVHKSKAGDYQRSWSLLSDSAFKGKLSILDDPREVFGAALAFLGHSVNSQNPDELEEAFKLIQEEWKPNLAKFDSEGFGKGFASFEQYAVHGFPAVIFEELTDSQKEEMEFFIPEEGGPMYIDCFVIPAGTEHYDLALKFIDFFLEPGNYARFLDRFHFPSALHSEAGSLMTETPYYTAQMLSRCESRLDVGEAFELYSSLWQKIRYI